MNRKVRKVTNNVRITEIVFFCEKLLPLRQNFNLKFNGT